MIKAASLCLILLTAPAMAAAPQAQITPQPLADALTTLARQSGLQLIYGSDAVRGRQSKGAPAGLSVREVLNRVLEGTGLEYEFLNERTVTIWVKGQERPSPRSTQLQIENLRLVQAEDPPAPARQDSAARTEAPPAAASEGIPEILVKGKKSLNTDIERTEDAPQPYVVFSREEIQRSQAVNLDEFFKTRLPMNTAATHAVPGAMNTVSSINLRGLGANQTLVLVDGRRLPSSVSSLLSTANQADLNGIPLSSIERIEVLPSTASGIYGGSATGGVINIVLRRDFRGVEARASYLNTFDTDASTRRADLSGGFSLEGGRTHVTLAASYSDANNLVIGDRDFSARAIALTLANNPAAILNAAQPPLGQTVNIRSVSGNLVLDSGQALGSNITHLPLGYAGPASDSGAALVANAGRYNLNFPAGVNGGERTLTSAPAMESASLNLRREFSDRMDVFLDFSRLGNKGTSSTIESPNLVANLPANAPNNPFQQAIVVRFPSPGLWEGIHSTSTTLRALGGIIARLPGDWRGEVDYSWNRSRFRNVAATSLLYDVALCVLGRGVGAGVDPDGAGPLLPCAEGDPRPALNALQEGNVFPIDYSPYRLPSPSNIQGPFDSVLKDVTLRLSGPVLQLPAGPLSLSTLIERRKEKVGDGYIKQIPSWPYPAEFIYSFHPSRAQDADSYHLEAQVPLISARNARRLARELTLQLSGRHDRYSTLSSPLTPYVLDSRDDRPPLVYTSSRQQSTDYTFALRYAPSGDIALRASFGTGFLPPAVTQIASSLFPDASFNLGNDPKRGGTPAYVGLPFDYISGGNPNLKPETSETWSVGLILTPRFAPGLRLSIDYTRIEKVDEIQSISPQFLIDNEDNLPGRVERGTRLATDLPGWAGPVTSVDLTSINIAWTQTEAYDVQLDYSLDAGAFGDFRAYVVATYQPHYLNQLLPTAAVTDRVGFNGGVLQWRGNVGFDWNKGPLSFGWNAQLYDDYRVYAVTASPASIPTTVRNQGSATIPRQVYHDIIATYRFDKAAASGRGLLADLEVSVGIQNLFDTSPPIIASTNPVAAGISLYGDPRLRRYSLSVRKGFGN